MMKIEFERWEPGLDGRFLDQRGASCSVADGFKRNGKHLLCLGTDDSRMVLTQDMVRALLPHLTRFVETGRLGGDE